MPLVVTPAIVLSTLRYGDSSKVVRLATREHGVQSAIAKGALRPRSRFGASLQLLSEGRAELVTREHRELQTLTGFDVRALRLGIGAEPRRFAAASALAELMLRFGQPAAHPEAFDLLSHALAVLEVTPPVAVEAVALRALWQLVAAFGFAPSLEACARCGEEVPAEGAAAFSASEGGVLCARCAVGHAGTRLPAEARADLTLLLAQSPELPALDTAHAAAHRRLFVRWIQAHLGAEAALPALGHWQADGPAAPGRG
ncbi:MAG: DNA repair protein RecO [Gemmatimonadales bacterium]|nr:DNA repair protein RecO [Gemmatimonadales bacterium]